MHPKWTILFYEDPNGEKPVESFLISLNEATQAKIARTFDLLEEFGIGLGSPRLKKISGPSLWELRILGTDSIRIFYVTLTGKTFLMLHGFKKKTQKTPRKEITIAQHRLSRFYLKKRT